MKNLISVFQNCPLQAISHNLLSFRYQKSQIESVSFFQEWNNEFVHITLILLKDLDLTF